MEEELFGEIPKADFLMLGRLLAMTREHSVEWFQTIAMKNKIGIRKAYYMLEIYYAFNDLKIPKESALEIGWTKAHVIASVINSKNWPYWVGQAKVLSLKELQDLVKGNPLSKEKKHCVLMYFTVQEFDQLSKVLTKFGALRKGRALYGKEKALLAALYRLDDKRGKGDAPRGLS